MAMKVRAIKVRVLLSSVVLLATLWLASCGHYTCGITFGSSTCSSSGSGISQGGGTTGSGVTAYVYYMDDKAGQITSESYNVSGSGTFVPTSGFASPALAPPTTPDFGMVTLDEAYLYVPFANDALYGFSIDSTDGALTAVSAAPYLIQAPTAIAADPNGAVLFIGGSGGITAFTVNANDGTLTVAGSGTTGGLSPTQLTTDGLGLYVYAVTPTAIYAFSYTGAGALTPVTNSPFSFSLAQISGEKTGKFLLGITAQDGAIGGVVDNSIYMFAIGTGGALTQLPTTTTVYSPIYMTVSPNGAFVYTFNENAALGSTQPDPMEGYTITSSGTLTPILGSPFASLAAAIGKFDQSGQNLFVDAVDSGVGGAFVYTADPTAGGLSSTLPQIGFPSFSFAVTDVP